MPITSQQTTIVKYTTGIFGAPPGGFLSTLTTANYTATQIAQAKVDLSYGPSVDNAAFVDAVAAAFLPTTITPSNFTAAKAGLTTLVNTPGSSRAAILVAVTDFIATLPANDPNFGIARTQFDNKVAVATFAANNGYSSTDLPAMTAILTPVTSDPATVTAAQAAITATLAPPTTGSTFILTPGDDIFTGTAGNDTFRGTQTTFNSTDTLVGGAGIDTLTVVDGGTAAFALPSATVSQIENINIKNINGVAAVAAIDETQTVIMTGTTSGPVSFLGVAIASSVNNDTAAATATKIVADKASIIAGAAAITAGITNIAAGGLGEVVVTFGGTAGKGDVPALAASAISAGITFTAGIELVKGVAAVNATGFADTVTATNFIGATAFNSDNSTNAITFSSVGTGQAVGIIGNGSTVNGAVNFTLGSTVVAETINIASGTTAGAITNTGASVATAIVNSTGASNTVDSIDLGTGTNVTALTVNASTDLTVTNLSADYAATSTLTVSGAATRVSFGSGSTANFKTIDASGLASGGLTIAGGSNLTSFRGGAGNDVFTTAALYGSNTAGIIAAGTGTDTLILNASTDMDSATKAAMYTGFETLRTAGTQDMSLLPGITAVQVNAATGSVNHMTAQQAAAVQLRTAGTTATFSLTDSTGTSDVLNLSMGVGAPSSTALGFSGAVTMNGFEILNITTNAGSAATAGANQTSTFGTAFVADSLTAINLKGQSVTLSDAATTKAVTIDASALVGNGTTGLTLGGNLAVGSVVTGSGIADVITMGTPGSTYNTGAGDDSISSTFTNLRSGSVYNSVNGGAGIDTLTITGGGALTMADADFKVLTNVEKITVASTTTNNQNIETGGFFDVNFKVGGATLTTTTTTGSVYIDANSFSGDLTVSSTSAAVTGDVKITTGTGNDRVTVVATSFTGSSTIITGAGNDTIIGSAAGQTINAGTGADTMTGGAGVDTYKFANTGDSGTPSATNFDTITNWESGKDIIGFVNALTTVSNATTSAAGVAAITVGSIIATFNAADTTLAQHIIAVEAGLTKSTAATNGGTAPTALNVATWNEGADSYVFVTDGTAGVSAGDTLIKLVGINNAGTFTLVGSNITHIS